MGIERPRDAGKESTDHEGRHLELRRVNPHRGGGDLVIAHRKETPPVSRVDQCQNGVQGHDGTPDGPEQVRCRKNPLHAARPADGVGVLENHPDDLPESERHHRQIIPTETEGRASDEEPCQRRSQSTAEKDRKEAQLGGP